MNIRPALLLILSSLLVGLVALTPGCGGDQPADTAAEQAAAQAATGPQRSAAAPGATVFIFSPENGATVGSPVTVKFGISGVGIAPAGQHTPNSGHHHLLIDTELANPDQPIPADAQHLHYGKGQTEAAVELEPGTHTLQLVLGDGNHIPHQPPIVSKVVTITVE